MSLKSIAETGELMLWGPRTSSASATGHRVRILMYHRFPGDLKNLTAQCEHLSRHYHPISLTELAQAARGEKELPPNSLAITVDDGYRDFNDAFPIFQKFGLKVTLYVVSGFAAGELWLWPDQLLYLLETTNRRRAAIGDANIDLTNPSGAFDPICQAMIAMKNQDRLDTLQGLSKSLEVELPTEVPDRFAALSWSELQRLAAEGLDIGSHTATHPILSKLERGLEIEIGSSKACIEEATRCAAVFCHFCYPNGRFADVGPAAIALAEKTGYETAVLAESGLAGPPFPLYELKRIGVDPSLPALYFERRVAGFRA